MFSNKSASTLGLRAAFAALVCLFLTEAALGQSLRIWYVAPTKEMLEEKFEPNELKSGFYRRYRGVMVGDKNRGKVRGMAPRVLKRTLNDLQPGTPLRQRIDRLLQISGGKVDVVLYLVDDRSGLSGPLPSTLQFDVFSEVGEEVTGVWPTSSVRPKGKRGDDRYQGEVWLGERSGTLIEQRWPGGEKAWEETILHHVAYTQFPDPRQAGPGGPSRKTYTGPLYAAYEEGGYGSDEFLWDTEIAMEEGLATFFGVVANPEGMGKRLEFWRQSGPRYRKGQLHRWMDVGGSELLSYESTATAFFLFFWKSVGQSQEQSYDMILDAAGSIWQAPGQRSLMAAAHHLALALEGRRAAAEETPIKSTFPFALIDILTHYGMTEEEYRKLYRAANPEPDRDPAGYEAYWAVRDTVRKEVERALSALDIETAVRQATVALSGQGLPVAASQVRVESFASDETGGAFLPAFETEDGSRIAPANRFRFLVGGGRTITFRVPGASTAPQTLTYRIIALEGSPPPDTGSGTLTTDEVTFTPRASIANRALSEAARPPVKYQIEITASSGAVLSSQVIAQDLIDRLRQESVDWALVLGNGFLNGSAGRLINNTPPRNEVAPATDSNHFSARELGGQRGVATPLNPHYYDPDSDIGIVWDNGFSDLADRIRDAYGGGLILTSGHRSPSHNRRESGAENSNHQWGTAVDLRPALAANPTRAQRIRAFFRLYNVAIPLSREALLENTRQRRVQRLWENWSPPRNDHVMDWCTSGGQGGEVRLVDSDCPADTFPESLAPHPDASSRRPPRGATGSIDGRRIVFTGPGGERRPADIPATGWRLDFGGLRDVQWEFRNATHVHAAR